MFTNKSPGSIHSGIKEANRRCGICCSLTAGTVFGVGSLAAYFLPSYQIGSFSLPVFCAGAAFSTFLTAGLFVFLIRPADHSSKPSADTSSAHEADLHIVNQNLSAIIEASPLAIVSLDAQGCVSIWNRAAEAILGWKHEEVVGRPYPAVPEDKRDEHREILQSVISDKGFADWDVTRVRKDGEPVDLTISTAPLLDQCGCVNGIMGIIADVTGNKKAEHDMRLLKRAIDSSINGIFIVDASAGHPISYVNPAFEKITGYSSDEVLGRNAGFLHGEDHDQHELVKLEEAVTAGEEGIFILRNYRKDGTLFWNELVVSPVKSAAGAISHFVAILNDITERKRIEAELVFLANHDPLTGLPNRNLFQDRLGQALAHSERYGEQIAVIFLDLDHFKMVNDTLGHKYGDLLLKGVAARIRGCLRKGDTVARPGGDEFALILPHITQSQDVITVAEKLVAAISSPFVISGREIYTSASLGITMYPGDGTTLESLLKNADTAVFHAKEQGRKNYQFYSSDMNVRALERMALEGSLRHALRKDEFILHYQPRVDLSTGNIIGMEALLRWQHPEQGLIFPSRFISLAEDTGLIIPIGEWVLRTACRQTQAWLDQGLSPVRIAVNLSALQFRQPDLVGKIADILKETGLDSSLLELEITESIAMQNAGQAIRTFQELKEMGIHLAIDDFGTGYSSLNYLKRFPIDMLKIDQSFVRDVSVDPDDAAIVKTIITMAHSLGLRVIAEGVETVDQLRFLLAHDCEEMQGYLFSKPVSAEAFAELLRTKKTLFVGGNLRSLSI